MLEPVMTFTSRNSVIFTQLLESTGLSCDCMDFSPASVQVAGNLTVNITCKSMHLIALVVFKHTLDSQCTLVASLMLKESLFDGKINTQLVASMFSTRDSGL